MKYLKIFEDFDGVDKEDIDSICQEFGIKNYTINSDGSIDVNGNVDLSPKAKPKALNTPLTNALCLSI